MSGVESYPRLVNSIDRNVEAHRLLRLLRPYLVDEKARDEAYGHLVLRVERLIECQRRGSDGDFT